MATPFVANAGFRGDYAAGDTIDFNFTTTDVGVPFALAGTPAVSVYKDSSRTQSTAGVTLTASFDSVTGLNHVTITTGSDGTFYAAGHQFDVVITTGTVNSGSVVGYVVGSFTTRLGASGGVFANGTNNGGVTIANSAGTALTLSSSGSNGSGLSATGNGSGHGISLVAGATGNGLKSLGGASSGAGAHFAAVGGGNGIEAAGTTTGHGLSLASDTGSAFRINSTGGGAGIDIALTGGTAGGIVINTDGDGLYMSTGGRCIYGISSATIGIEMHGVGAAVSFTGTGAGMNISGSTSGLNIATSTGIGLAIDGGSGGTDVALAITSGGAAAVSILGAGTSAGLLITGGDTGSAVALVGGATSGVGLDITTTSGDAIYAHPTAGHGLNLAANGTSKHGIKTTGAGNGNGVLATGQGTGAGLSIAGGGTGPGLSTSGALTESYAALHTAPTLEQALYMILQYLNERSTAGTTSTVNKVDGSTQAATFTLNSATSPTSITRAS